MKKQPATPSLSAQASVGFVVYSQSPQAETLRVELGPFQARAATIRLSQADGPLLLEEAYSPVRHPARLQITLRDLAAGTYFFELSDGFFHQVKEVRIAAEE
ncbi:MAG: hypothetical protein D6722_24415 [Bacteroidetes bacterium]|nr:MAG: hypothetical protein D6722_24415 [Bacteroidota bacterium]